MPHELEPAPPLYHAHQTLLYGCIYHAAYALIGDETLLEHVSDMSTGAWLARLGQRGYAVNALYNTYILAGYVDDAPLTRRGWEQVRSLASRNRMEALPLLVTVVSERVQGFHLIALHLPHRSIDCVRISDSAKPGLQSLTWSEFLASRYARSYEVSHLVSLNPDHHPHELPNPVPKLLQASP